MTQSIYNRYLNILGVSKRKPGLDALAEILKAHLIQIPFENISKIYYLKNFGNTFMPDFELFIEGILKNNFGGTCYSNNYYLNRLLNYLGYNIRLCGADMSDPDVHFVSIVNIDHREYLADVGYGAPFFDPLPLDLSENYELTFGRDQYILKPKNKNHYSELQLFRDGIRKHGYIVKPHPRSISEFETVIKDSFKSSATFLNAILLIKFGVNFSIAIHNFSLIETMGSNSKKVVLKDKKNLIDQIYRRFRISKEIVKESLSLISNYEDAWN